MDIRAFLAWSEEQGILTAVEKEVDPHIELPALIYAMSESPSLFSDVKRTGWRVAAGLCSRRDHFAWALGTDQQGIVPNLMKALDRPIAPPRIRSSAPCQEVVEAEVDLSSIPILKHLEGDGGPYVTSGIAVIQDPDHGRNTSYHRLMQIGSKTFTARIVENRGTDTALRKAFASGRDLEIAICLGAPIHVLLAASLSPPMGTDELSIAHALAPTPVVPCQTVGIEVPAHCEAILEGRVTSRVQAEGPFIDLTETWDMVRQQPVIEIQRVTHRHAPIYHALLPGGLEHKLLMGLPREPTIFQAVAQVADCRGVSITPGGTSWLHAIVQIARRDEGDSRRAIDATFRGHTSLKHVVIVDEDIDIYDMADVEWAIATRFQADRDLYVFTDQPSSSLDPSAKSVPGQKSKSAKMGLDATIPWTDHSGSVLGTSKRDGYRKVAYPPINLRKYLEGAD